LLVGIVLEWRHTVIRKTLLSLTLAALCATPALAQTADIPSLFSLSQGNAADRANYRDIIAGGIRDVPCVNVDSKDLARAQGDVAWGQSHFPPGYKDYATCPNGHIDLITVAPPVSAAETARYNAAIAAPLHNALTAALTAANVHAFNNTIAAGSSRGCRAMASNLILQFASNPMHNAGTGEVMNDPYGLSLLEWAQAATAAKVCVTEVHAETSDAAPMRLPKLVLAAACSNLKDHFAKSKDDVDASYSSWACGWPAPIPALGGVPRE
jgi:hypothetical protein